MWIFLVGAALAGSTPGKYDALNPDIEVSRVIASEPATLFAYMLDLTHVQALFPPDCIGLWQMGQRTSGVGATAVVRYDMALMHRKLGMTLTHAVEPAYIDFDHPGPKGFVTRWHFDTDAASGGTNVRIETPLNGPPWPLKGYYFNVVKPEWEGCYRRTLENLATAAAKSSG
jgi:hypothetical protein